MNFFDFIRKFNQKTNTHDQASTIKSLNEKIKYQQQQLAKYINKFLQTEEKWKLINFLTKKVNSTLEIEQILQLICAQVVKLVSSDICSIYHYDLEDNKLKIKHSNAKEESEQSNYMKNFVENKNLFLEKVINQNISICPTSIKNFLNEDLKPNFYITPITNNTDFFGIIFLYKKAESITQEETSILQIIAENIVMAIKNAQLYQKINQSNKNKIEFIATLSHEFKTPLNTIIGFSEIISSDETLTKEQIKKYSGNILKCSNHLLKLIEDIQDASIAESGNISLFYEKFNPKTIISECLSQMESIINKKNIQVVATLVDTTVNADTKRFRQVIFNLFSNAIKFSENTGKIKILSYLSESGFVFEITNYGQTIAPSEKDEMFKLFYQRKPSTQNNYKGAGIGLALCKKIIDLHCGQIDYSSSIEKGTTFWFEIPLNESKQGLSTASANKDSQ